MIENLYPHKHKLHKLCKNKKCNRATTINKDYCYICSRAFRDGYVRAYGKYYNKNNRKK